MTFLGKRIIPNLLLNIWCPIHSGFSRKACRTVSVVKLTNVNSKLLFNMYLTCSVPGSGHGTGIWQRMALIKLTAIIAVTSTGGMQIINDINK